jgi:DNA-binding transcriptional MerR regulator
MISLPEIQAGNNEPLYNIGAVSRMTGISMVTLRAWERRYGFPDSVRTEGGHRLFSEKELLRLRWVKARIDEGMQTAQSINALRHQEQTGHHLLIEQNVVLPRTNIEQQRTYIESVQHRLYDALSQHNLQLADETLSEALALISLDDLIIHVIGPVFYNVGECWEKGKINIAVEHLATNYLRQRLLMWMLSGPTPLFKSPIVLACAPGEWHEGGLLMIGSILRRHRYPVVYLGQSVPLVDLGKFIQDINPVLVVLAAMTEGSAKELFNWPQIIGDVVKAAKIIIGYGGRIFVEKPEWQKIIEGIYLGNTIEECISSIERQFTFL